MKNLDTIYINNLKASCFIGIFDFERKQKQEITVNIAMSVDLNQSGKTDDIRDTVSYKDICDQIDAFVEKTNFHLIEKLAEEVAKICLENKKVMQVKVRIDKPKALPFADSASVEIVRIK